MSSRFQERAKDMAGLQRTGIVLPLALGAASGMSFFSLPFPYSHWAAPAFGAAVLFLVLLLRNPVWALFTTLFVVLLPIGLIPPEVHSILNRSMVVLALVTHLAGVMAGRSSTTWSITTSFMGAFLLWATVTLIWASDWEVGTTTLFMYGVRFSLFLLLIPSIVKTKTGLDGLMKTLALSGWLLILISIGVALAGGYAPGIRLQVLKVNANELGMLAILTMTGVLWHGLQPSKQGCSMKRISAWIFLFMTVVVVAMSGSRGSAISLVVTLLAFSIFKATRSWGVLSLIAMCIAAVSAPFLFDTLFDRFALADGDTPLGGREVLWAGGWQLIREFPLLGVGVGNSPFQVLRSLNMADPEGLPLHNPILVVWSETGPLGLVLYLAVPLSAIWSFLRQHKRSRRDRAPWPTPYFAIVWSVFLGYMASWIKSGGGETDVIYFLIVALLRIPSVLEFTKPHIIDPFDPKPSKQARHAGPNGKRS